MSRKLSFRVAPGVSVPCPQVWPIDEITGEDIERVRKCEVVSEHDGVTIMRIEVIVLNKDYK